MVGWWSLPEIEQSPGIRRFTVEAARTVAGYHLLVGYCRLWAGLRIRTRVHQLHALKFRHCPQAVHLACKVHVVTESRIRQLRAGSTFGDHATTATVSSAVTACATAEAAAGTRSVRGSDRTIDRSTDQTPLNPSGFGRQL